MSNIKNINTIVILAGGVGKRLDIFETPKPLIKLRNKSLIIRSVQMAKLAGIKNIYVVIRKGDKLIKKELIDYDVKFIEKTDNKKGMLDSILSIQNVLEGHFIVMMCDLLFNHNPLLLFKKQKKYPIDSIAILVSTNKKYNSISGSKEKAVLFDGKISYDFIRSDNFVYEAGIYYFTKQSYKKFVQIASENKNIKKVSEVFKIYEKRGKLLPVIMNDNQWFDINTPVDLIRAELFLRYKKSKNNIQKECKIPKYKKLKILTSYRYNKPLRFDVNVGRGIIDKISEFEIIPHEYYYSPHHIIIDKNIYNLYGKKIYEQLKDLGYNVHKILVDPGEYSKSIEVYTKIANQIITLGVDKKSIIISVGGGVIKDLAGFLASTIYRGIGFIGFPTTVLSQADAAIALKQGVNGTLGKNLLGSYYSPMKIIVDPNTLLTLNKRYIYDGLAECLKQSFTYDYEFYKFFKKYNGPVIGDVDFLEEAVKRAIELKVKSIQEDYNEENIALVNQYGHEIGHAVEHLSGYKLLHGEAVAVGMRVSAELSQILGITDKDVVDAHIELLQKYNLPVRVPRYIKSEDIINSLRFSKKFHGNKARFVLVDKIGSIWHDDRYYFVTCEDTIIKEAIKRSYRV